MFKTRLLSGIILTLVALITIICGEDVLFGTILLVSVIGMTELYKIFDIHKKLLGVVGYVALAGYFSLIRFGLTEWVLGLTISFLILLMAIYVFAYPKYHSKHVMLAFFGLFYVGIMLSFVYQTRMLEGGAFLVWLIFICSWGCDTSAYCFGMLLGKHKLAPILSPKKSIEGAIGGVFGAALIGVIYGLCVNRFANAGVDLVMYAIISAVGAVISQIGDLAASGIKRNHDIKDYGKLIPGHGGVLDRFDSVIITAPIIYYLAILML